MRPTFITLFLILVLLSACGGKSPAAASESAASAQSEAALPAFSADSAWAYVAAQTSFGPRVPNTPAHANCCAWLAQTLKKFGAEDITIDSCVLTAYDGTKLQARNITASINPSAQKRILLLSHWDSRPWADHDPDPAMRLKPIDGANDGASGVGVILELARIMALAKPSVGVDILLVDAEDYGRREGDESAEANDESWALGTQHWAQYPTLDTDKIRYAVLLDMVGGKDAVFAREYFSERNARAINDRVWKAAAEAGHADRFVDTEGIPVLDDHVYLLKAGIPAIDIVECSNPQTGSFNPTWHTMADNIDNIDKATLKAVGETLVRLIYSE